MRSACVRTDIASDWILSGILSSEWMLKSGLNRRERLCRSRNIACSQTKDGQVARTQTKLGARQCHFDDHKVLHSQTWHVSQSEILPRIEFIDPSHEHALEPTATRNDKTPSSDELVTDLSVTKSLSVSSSKPAFDTQHHRVLQSRYPPLVLTVSLVVHTSIPHVVSILLLLMFNARLLHVPLHPV